MDYLNFSLTSIEICVFNALTNTVPFKRKSKVDGYTRAEKFHNKHVNAGRLPAKSPYKTWTRLIFYLFAKVHTHQL